MARSDLNLAWIDLEMTGLSPENDRIIEIATVVTDKDLNILAEGPVIAVHQSDEVLASMDAWNRRTHGRSGLTERVRLSTVDEAAALSQTLGFLKEWIAPGKSPMAGNSICQDRRFLALHMPELESFFHYRNLDVSTVKELALRWAPTIKEGFKKKNTHKALDDILESIEEMRYYRTQFFKP